MGRARELTMGPKRPRRSVPGLAALRRFTDADAPDVAAFRARLDEVGTGPGLRPGEALVYARACARYRELTGEAYGPTIATR